MELPCRVHSCPPALLPTHIMPSCPPTAATKIMWMKRHEPEHYQRLAHVLLPHDYINWWLTGRMAMEVGM
jgi:sugar (pentulose or hexulose) kinase